MLRAMGPAPFVRRYPTGMMLRLRLWWHCLRRWHRPAVAQDWTGVVTFRYCHTCGWAPDDEEGDG